jgi:hypothetical protein
MIWFFERRDARLLFEIRRQSDGDDYELVVTFPNGRQDVERFKDPHDLIERSQRLQDALRADGWQPPSSVRAASSRNPSAA